MHEFPPSPKLGDILGEEDAEMQEEAREPVPAQWEGPPLITPANQPKWTEIPQDWKDLVYEKKKGKDEEIVVQLMEGGLSNKELRSLERSSLLQGPVIGSYAKLVVLRNEKTGPPLPKVHFINSFRTTGMMFGNLSAGPEGPKRVFDYEYVFCPFNVGPEGESPDHWILLVIDVIGHKIHCFDSMDGLHPTIKRRSHAKCKQALLNYIQDQHFIFGIAIQEYVEVDHRDIPFQEGFTDCGVYVCMYMEHFARRAPFIFSQKDIPYWRERIGCELVAGRLLD